MQKGGRDLSCAHPRLACGAENSAQTDMPTAFHHTLEYCIHYVRRKVSHNEWRRVQKWRSVITSVVTYVNTSHTRRDHVRGHVRDHVRDHVATYVITSVITYVNHGVRDHAP